MVCFFSSGPHPVTDQRDRTGDSTGSRGGLSAILHRYSIDIVSIQYRYYIDTISILYRYSIDIVSIQYGYSINTVSILYRYSLDTASTQYRYFVDTVSILARYTIDMVTIQYRQVSTSIDIESTAALPHIHPFQVGPFAAPPR